MKFTKQERSGIFFLLLLIVLLQLGYFLWKRFSSDNQFGTLQVNTEMQTKIEGLKKKSKERDSVKIYLFNPNFISDYKGYSIGMSVVEIDRLHNFRKTEKYVNSPEEFQKVTQVSDSLLKIIAPYFKFPEWTQKTKRQTFSSTGYKSSNSKIATAKNISKRDLNSASPEDLKSINGIGEKLSERIVKFRNRLGGFLIEDQLYDVYGLDPEVVVRTLRHFEIKTKPDIRKINLNTASVDEISKLVYIRYKVANEIIQYRSINGTIESFDELGQIEDFPIEKIDRLALYLFL